MAPMKLPAFGDRGAAVAAAGAPISLQNAVSAGSRVWLACAGQILDGHNAHEAGFGTSRC